MQRHPETLQAYGTGLQVIYLKLTNSLELFKIISDGEGGFLPPSLAFGGPWGPPFFFVINVRFWPIADG